MKEIAALAAARTGQQFDRCHVGSQSRMLGSLTNIHHRKKRPLPDRVGQRP